MLLRYVIAVGIGAILWIVTKWRGSLRSLVRLLSTKEKQHTRVSQKEPRQRKIPQSDGPTMKVYNENVTLFDRGIPLKMYPIVRRRD